MITGDWDDSAWLYLIEDEGPDRLGRVLGYLVFETEMDAQHMTLGEACEACGLFVGEEIPRDVIQPEITSYADFKKYYGNRMPLRNRGKI